MSPRPASPLFSATFQVDRGVPPRYVAARQEEEE